MLMRMELERYRLVYVKCMYMNEEALVRLSTSPDYLLIF